jgi:hypothetical protein
MGTYRGAAIISSTPADNPMGAYREGYLIARAADGGQITDMIRNLLNGFVNPDQTDWLLFQKTAEGAVSSIITNSNDIRDGHLQVREMLNGVTGMAMAVWGTQMLALNMSMGLYAAAFTSISLQSMDDFLSKTWLLYIDFENNSYYDPTQNNAVRTAKYCVLDILGQSKFGVKAQGTVTHKKETKPLDENSITATGSNGCGTFTFSYDNISKLAPGDYIIVDLQVTPPDGKLVRTRGAFLIKGPDLDIDTNNEKGFELPGRSVEEDLIEDEDGSPETPGKLILINNGDDDGDEVPNFADGINKFNNEGTDAGGQFVPIVFELSDNFDITKTRITFDYDASDPGAVKQEVLPTNPVLYGPSGTSMGNPNM